MNDTGPAKLPGIPAYRTSDTALANTLAAIIERLEVREGARGNVAEKVVTQRDLAAVTQFMGDMAAPTRKAQEGDLAIDLGGGRTSSIPMDALIKSLTGNPAFMTAVTPLLATDSKDTGATESARVEATLRALINELGSALGFRDQFTYGPGPYGPRWYINSTMGLNAQTDGVYDTTVGDILRSMFSTAGRVAYLEQREAEITAVSTQYFAEIFGRLAAHGI